MFSFVHGRLKPSECAVTMLLRLLRVRVTKRKASAFSFIFTYHLLHVAHVELLGAVTSHQGTENIVDSHYL